LRLIGQTRNPNEKQTGFPGNGLLEEVKFGSSNDEYGSPLLTGEQIKGD